MPPPHRKGHPTDLVQLYDRRRRGVVVTDPQGRQFVATLGPGLALVGTTLVLANAAIPLQDGAGGLIGDGSGGLVYVTV